MSNHPLYGLGAIPSTVDTRDHHYAWYLPVEATNTVLPTSWSNSAKMQAVRNQGQEGTCCGHALACSVLGWQEQMNPSPAKPFGRVLSPRDVYAGARQITPVNGEGAQLRAALQFVQQSGACLESDWPYIVHGTSQPYSTAANNRPLNKLKNYAAVPLNTQDIKTAIYHLGPVLIAIPVYNGFYTPTADGLVSTTGTLQGSHAVSLIGWDDSKQAYRLRNSWGTAWGQSGECWLPYGYPLYEVWSVIPGFVAALSVPCPPAPAPSPMPWWRVLLGFFRL